MRERADRRAKLAEFNKGELEREKAAKAKKALQEKLRADKKAEIMDRMRRKQQEEEEKREKDEIEAQKQREIEAEKQAASGLAKMGLVDPSLRKKEHGPKAVAKKAQRFYNSVVHGVADKKVEQQETSNMTQSFVSVLTPSTRVVSISRCRGWSLLRFRAVSDHVGAVVAARQRERGRCDGVLAKTCTLLALLAELFDES